MYAVEKICTYVCEIKRDNFFIFCDDVCRLNQAISPIKQHIKSFFHQPINKRNDGMKISYPDAIHYFQLRYRKI